MSERRREKLCLVACKLHPPMGTIKHILTRLSLLDPSSVDAMQLFLRAEPNGMVPCVSVFAESSIVIAKQPGIDAPILCFSSQSPKLADQRRTVWVLSQKAIPKIQTAAVPSREYSFLHPPHAPAPIAAIYPASGFSLPLVYASRTPARPRRAPEPSRAAAAGSHYISAAVRLTSRTRGPHGGTKPYYYYY